MKIQYKYKYKYLYWKNHVTKSRNDVTKFLFHIHILHVIIQKKIRLQIDIYSIVLKR